MSSGPLQVVALYTLNYCMLTTRRSAATLLRRMSCSCRSGFRDAWMTLQNGCNLIVFNSTQPRRKCSGVHPFDVSIRFHSPVCVSASTSLFRPILFETSEYIWTVTSAWWLKVKVVSSCFEVLRRLRSICSSTTRPVFVSRSSYHWFCLALTTAMPHSPDCGPCSTRLLGWSTLPVEPNTWHRSSVICTGFVIPIGSTIYKLAVLVYRCLHGLAPGYLCDEFTRVSEIVSRRNLRSASTASFVVPRFQRKTLGGRALPVAADQAWNSLQSHVTSSSSLASFKRSLKTELFLRSYVEAWYRLMLHVTFNFDFVTCPRSQHWFMSR